MALAPFEGMTDGCHNEASLPELSRRVDSRFSPLYLLAPARSCSSLIVAMLGQHPELYGFPELRLFRARNVTELLMDVSPRQGMSVRERLAGLLRTLAQLHEGQQTDEAVESAYGWLERRARWSVASVFGYLLELVSPLTGVEKSPETSRTDEALRRAAAAYPSARVLHLVRHPWSTVQSMLKAWGALSYWNVDQEAAPQYCLNVWLEQHRRIAEFGESLGSDRFMRVRAEDVVNRPLEVLPVFCRWMGIDDGDDSVRAMMHPERSPYVSHGPMNARGGYDPKFLADPRPRQVQLPPRAIPDGWRVDDELRQATVELAGRFGYDIEISAPSHAAYTSSNGLRRLHPTRLGLPRRRP